MGDAGAATERGRTALVTAYYSDPKPARRDEFLECVRRNAANPLFGELHVFCEDGTPPGLDDPKVRAVPLGRRATYRDLFDYANRNLAGWRVVVANADIYFGDDLRRLDAYDLDGKLLCLSRWDVQADGSARFFEHGESQDAWVFVAPVRPFPCDFHFGVPGCDNRLAWEAAQAGLQVENPGRSLRAYHLHLSGVRRYHDRQRVRGPTLSVPAQFLGPPVDLRPATVAFSEAMGYRISTLEPGMSSHVNIERPFSAPPEPLRGLAFTQVVANSVSPLLIEFRSPGKLFVLVGDDWAGAAVARDWVAAAGFIEDLPRVATAVGAGFEVWSIVGDVGEHVVAPTQVMLVAQRLVPSQRRAARDVVRALTSLTPSKDAASVTRECIESWRRAGLEVLAFNHPSEIAQLRELYDVDFVPVAATSAEIFGRHCVPISSILQWAADHPCPVLLINSDIRLELEPWELNRIRRLSDDGLCYFVRFNHDGVVGRAMRDTFGIDAFLFHGRHAAGLPNSFLSMGQPFWDYWLPLAFAARQQPVYGIDYAAAVHRRHATRWSWSAWHRCALEFARVCGVGPSDTFESCLSMSAQTRRIIDARKRAIARRPPRIADWVRRKFGRGGAKVVVELGSYRGEDTAWLARLPGVTVYAFEPDPRNDQPPRRNVVLHRAAIAQRDGRGPLILSERGWGQEWTHSSSIRQPKNHLVRYPVTFGRSVEVEFVTLDSFYRRHGLDVIDFIWADVQGAEIDMIRSGRAALAHTRYLYTEYSDDKLYEGQATLSELLGLLPDFRVVELWPDDVLLENRELQT
jgi:FkbM family methyltransferase